MPGALTSPAWDGPGRPIGSRALDDAGFDTWVAQAADSAEALDRARYLELEKPSENVPPMAFAPVDPQLFSRVVNMCVEEGRMCMAEMTALDAQGGLDRAAMRRRSGSSTTSAPGWP